MPASDITYNKFSYIFPNIPWFINDEALATEIVRIREVKNNYYNEGWKETHILGLDTKNIINLNFFRFRRRAKRKIRGASEAHKIKAAPK